MSDQDRREGAARAEYVNPRVKRLVEAAREAGLCCALHAFNTDDGAHPEWVCSCSHCTAAKGNG